MFEETDKIYKWNNSMVTIFSEWIHNLIYFFQSCLMYLKSIFRNLNILVELKLRQDSTVNSHWRFISNKHISYSCAVFSNIGDVIPQH